MSPGYFAAEFPHDNPELWRCPEMSVPQLPEPEAAPESDDFERLIVALGDVALAAGATRAAAQLQLLLRGERAPDASPRAAALATVAPAWRAVLDGSSNDLGACGDLSLDEWGAALLAELMETPSRATELRRELRSRGVAAFGMIEQAA